MKYICHIHKPEALSVGMESLEITSDALIITLSCGHEVTIFAGGYEGPMADNKPAKIRLWDTGKKTLPFSKK